MAVRIRAIADVNDATRSINQLSNSIRKLQRQGRGIRIDTRVTGERQVRSLDRSLQFANQSATRLSTTMRGLGTAIIAAFSFSLVTRFFGAITDASDTVIQIANQLKAAGLAAGDIAAAQQDVLDLAIETRSTLEATGGLYARILRSTNDLGISQKQALDITRAFQQSLALSGASAQEAASASLQFGQALASGRLQGDELRSILENNSFFAQAVARHLGVGVGQLRKMGEEGKLTSAVLAGISLDIAGDIDFQFAGLTPTFQEATTVLRTGFDVLLEIVGDFVGNTLGLNFALISIGEQLVALRKNSDALQKALSIAFNVGSIIVKLAILVTGIRVVVSVFTLLINAVRSIIALFRGASTVFESFLDGVIGIVGRDRITKAVEAIIGRPFEQIRKATQAAKAAIAGFVLTVGAAVIAGLDFLDVWGDIVALFQDFGLVEPDRIIFTGEQIAREEEIRRRRIIAGIEEIAKARRKAERERVAGLTILGKAQDAYTKALKEFQKVGAGSTEFIRAHAALEAALREEIAATIRVIELRGGSTEELDKKLASLNDRLDKLVGTKPTALVRLTAAQEAYTRALDVFNTIGDNAITLLDAREEYEQALEEVITKNTAIVDLYGDAYGNLTRQILGAKIALEELRGVPIITPVQVLPEDFPDPGVLDGEDGVSDKTLTGDNKEEHLPLVFHFNRVMARKKTYLTLRGYNLSSLKARILLVCLRIP